MTEQYKPNIGELCEKGALRDAVHIAVAPVVAGHVLPPGHHVALDGRGKAIAVNGDRRDEKTVGIVDPFLERWVDEGETFWLFLYPGTVTKLRHAWLHPAFQVKLPGGKEYPKDAP